MLCSCAHAFAQPSEPAPWRLKYTRSADAPVNCPEESYIRTALAAKLRGVDPFIDDAPRAISIRIVLISERVEARIEAHDENGSLIADQTIHAPSWRCDQLADRTVFILRDIIDPLVATTPQATAPSSAPAPSSIPLPSPPAATPTPVSIARQPLAKAPARSPWIPSLALSAAAGGSWWSAPETAITLAVGVEARWRHVSIGIEGLYDHAWRLPITQRMNASLAGLSLLACGRGPFLRARAFARGCVFGHVAVLSITPDSDKVEDLSDDGDLMVDIGARLGVGFWLARSIGLELDGDLAFIPRPPTFVADGEELWRAPRFTGAVRGGLVFLIDLQ